MLIDKSACITIITISPGNTVVDSESMQSYGFDMFASKFLRLTMDIRDTVSSSSHRQENIGSHVVQAVLLPLNVLLNVVRLEIMTTDMSSCTNYSLANV